MSTAASQTNQAKLSRAREAWTETLDTALQRGFHGSIVIEMAIQDGTIQHVRRRVEQLEK
jgi:hypothetical protein